MRPWRVVKHGVFERYHNLSEASFWSRVSSPYPSLFIEDEFVPLDGREKLLLHLSLFIEDELLSSCLSSKVTTTPRPPPPSSSLYLFGDGRRSRSDHLLFYGRGEGDQK